MSHNQHADRTWWLRLDVLAAVSGVLLGLVFIPLYQVVTHLYILGIPLMLALASVVYLVSIRSETETALAPLPVWAARGFPSLSVLGMAALVYLSAAAGSRTVAFHSVAIGVAVLLFYQIIFVPDREFSVPIVLGQVIAFAIVLRFAALYVTPAFVGIDIWTHVPNWTAGIVETGSLAPLDGEKYLAAPWYHLLVATAALLGGLPLDTGLALSVGLVMSLVALVVYAAARTFTTPRWSTFAAAIVAVIGYTVEWSIHLIPTSLGLAFFAGSFYLLCRLLYYRFDTAEFLLLFAFNVAVVLTHQVATFITLVLLFSSVVTLVLLPGGLFPTDRDRVSHRSSRLEATNLTGLFVFDLGFVTFMWSLTPMRGRSFLETTFIFFENTLTESEGFGDLASESGPADAPPIEQTAMEIVVSYIDAAVFLSLFFLAAVGGLYVLHQRNLSYAPFMMGVATAAMAVFVFAFPAFGIRSFIPNRWYAFMAIPMALLAAFGAAHVNDAVNPTVAVAVLLCFALVFPTAAIVSSSGTIDSPAFPAEQTRYSYTEAEVAAVQTVDEVLPPPPPPAEEDEAAGIRTDHPYQTVFERTGAHPAGMLDLTEDGLASADVIVYRDYQRSGAAYFNDAYGRSVSPAVPADVVCPPRRSTVYDNGDVTICVS